MKYSQQFFARTLLFSFVLLSTEVLAEVIPWTPNAHHVKKKKAQKERREISISKEILSSEKDKIQTVQEWHRKNRVRHPRRVQHPRKDQSFVTKPPFSNPSLTPEAQPLMPEVQRDPVHPKASADYDSYKEPPRYGRL